MAGREQPCPRCQATLVVPTGAKTAPPESDDSYEFWDDRDGSYFDSELARQKLIPVVCGRCQTRMYAILDQVGQRLTCPDCGVKTVVPPPPKPKNQQRPARLE